ncbi:hypothetical protein HQ524_04390 [Candidatus Uhrbacteria bacterium]|nr:hypothetical protein [Candidatus Uhrbacteria bacterium]
MSNIHAFTPGMLVCLLVIPNEVVLRQVLGELYGPLFMASVIMAPIAWWMWRVAWSERQDVICLFGDVDGGAMIFMGHREKAPRADGPWEKKITIPRHRFFGRMWRYSGWKLSQDRFTDKLVVIDPIGQRLHFSRLEHYSYRRNLLLWIIQAIIWERKTGANLLVLAEKHAEEYASRCSTEAAKVAKRS